MFNSEPQETWTKEDAEEFERYAVAHLKKMWMSAAWAGAALLMNILCVVPFLYGWPLHSHWDVSNPHFNGFASLGDVQGKSCLVIVAKFSRDISRI